MSESVILVETVQTKPYIFLLTSDDETDHAVRIISRNLVEPNELRRIPILSVLHVFRDGTDQTWGAMWHLHGRHLAHGWAKCHAFRIS